MDYRHLVHRVCLLQNLYRIDAEMNCCSALMFELPMDREVVEKLATILTSPHITQHDQKRFWQSCCLHPTRPTSQEATTTWKWLIHSQSIQHQSRLDKTDQMRRLALSHSSWSPGRSIHVPHLVCKTKADPMIWRVSESPIHQRHLPLSGMHQDNS